MKEPATTAYKPGYCMNNYRIAKQENIGNNMHLFLLDISENIGHVNNSIIPQKQIDEISKYLVKRDRDKRLLARAFLYDYLQKHYGIDDFELDFCQYKKPFLKANPGFNFSFSYTENHVLLGISVNKKMGVDIEYINPTIMLDELASEIMCPAEWQVFNTYPLNSTEQYHYFFKLFSAKESIIKCFGTGLYYNVKNLQITEGAHYNYMGVDYIYQNLGLWNNENVLSLCYEK